MADHFIPLRRSELVDLLGNDPDLAPSEREPFGELVRYLLASSQFEYHQLLEKLKASYAPFDPDSDTKALQQFLNNERQQKIIDLLADFATVMERANYKHLTRDDFAPAFHACSDWGLLVDVDFRMFERLAIFARGNVVERRPLRRLRGFYTQEEVDVPVYQRLVMIMKLRKHPRLDRHIDTDKVYLQFFKNIPKLDIHMLLPGARVRMTRLDRGKIGLPMLSGLAMALYNIAEDFVTRLMHALANPSLMLWGLATGAFSYGTKSYFSYLSTRQRYNLNLTQVLYFQNLDTNTGVLVRVLDEAQEQEGREILLSYYFLWRQAGTDGWSRIVLRETIEKELQKRAGLQVSLAVDDALVKLEQMHLIEKTDDRYRAVPLNQAVVRLKTAWSLCLTAKPSDRWAAIRERAQGTADYSI